MWTISQIKQRGKAAFKRNYWKSVLVVLLVTGLATSAVTLSVDRANEASEELQERTEQMYSSPSNKEFHPTATSFSMGGNDFGYDNSMDFFNEYGDDNSFFFDYGDDDIYEDFYGSVANEADTTDNFHKFLEGLTLAQLIMVSLFLALVSLAIAVAVDIFIMNPLGMGGSRFFLCNLEQPADVKEMCFGFDRNYKNVVKILFFRNLYLALWTLLLIIPGIVKAYEYRMIPYLLAEHPEMSKEQAFATSRQMMMGEKWHAFCLDLSFIGWYILSLITFGLLEVFYVGPYKASANAALYENLKYSKGTSSTSYYHSVPPITPIPGVER